MQFINYTLLCFCIFHSLFNAFAMQNYNIYNYHLSSDNQKKLNKIKSSITENKQQLYIFASMSLDKSQWQELVKFAKFFNVPILLRGVNNKQEELFSQLRYIQHKLLNEYKLDDFILHVNPQPFEKYEITQVPAIVYIDNDYKYTQYATTSLSRFLKNIENKLVKFTYASSRLKNITELNQMTIMKQRLFTYIKDLSLNNKEELSLFVDQKMQRLTDDYLAKQKTLLKQESITTQNLPQVQKFSFYNDNTRKFLLNNSQKDSILTIENSSSLQVLNADSLIELLHILQFVNKQKFVLNKISMLYIIRHWPLLNADFIENLLSLKLIDKSQYNYIKKFFVINNKINSWQSFIILRYIFNGNLYWWTPLLQQKFMNLIPSVQITKITLDPANDNVIIQKEL